jgi:hypothetical protein
MRIAAVVNEQGLMSYYLKCVVNVNEREVHVIEGFDSLGVDW